jgi:subtilisin family serine protease
MSDTQEYVVTAKTIDDATSLLDDMETPGGNLYIPNRAVEVSQRREISRNTHFLITVEEAEQLRNDPRVLAVELLPSAQGIVAEPHWIQTGNFEKSATIDTNDKNWGLYRTIAGNNLATWGTNGSFTQTLQTITTTSSGKNVDVVVVDAHINFNHPEFAVNSDGTGGSRAIQYDWFQHSAALALSTTGPYSYSSISSNHGTHVAGTVAGNTQGWARDANIYNMEFIYAGGNGPAGNWTLYIFDYLRAFHLNKPINPATGKRNPTVTNHSWGYSYDQDGIIPLSDVTSVTFRGTTTAVTGTDANKKTILEANGVPVPFNSYLYRPPARSAALDADIQDAIAEGIIVVASAGNSYWNCTTNDLQDWLNTVTATGIGTWYHMQGASPGAADNVICVGSVGTTTQEYKSTFSNYGKRINIWAPGSNIVSAVYNTTAAAEFVVTLVNDPRDSNYKLGSISGTSMSGPQVAGYLACVAEQQPRLKQAEALQHLISNSNTTVGNSAGSWGDYTSLGPNSNNRYMFYKLVRPVSGATTPAVRFKDRPALGTVYPRPRIRKFG